MNYFVSLASDPLDDAEAELSRHLNLWRFREDQGGRRRSTFTSRIVDGARLVECVFVPSTGSRGPDEISSDPCEEFCLVFVNEGEEQWQSGSEMLDVSPGTIATWLTSRPMAFRVRRHLHKFVLTIPWHRVQNILDDRHLRPGMVIRPQLGMDAILFDSVSSLFLNHAALSDRQFTAVVDNLIMMLGLHEASERFDAQPRTSLYERAINHIEARLQDAQLTPQKVADFLGISLRYLHSQFNRRGHSVSHWIVRRRLIRCRDELEAAPARSISEVAYRWGFKSHAHFSRAFRAQFGMSPSDLRSGRTGFPPHLQDEAPRPALHVARGEAGTCDLPKADTLPAGQRCSNRA